MEKIFKTPSLLGLANVLPKQGLTANLYTKSILLPRGMTINETTTTPSAQVHIIFPDQKSNACFLEWLGESLEGQDYMRAMIDTLVHDRTHNKKEGAVTGVTLSPALYDALKNNHTTYAIFKGNYYGYLTHNVQTYCRDSDLDNYKKATCSVCGKSCIIGDRTCKCGVMKELDIIIRRR